MREAVARMRAATGLDIVVSGAFGGHAPNWNFEAAPITPEDPISVSWQDGDAIAELTDHTAGLGGSRIIVSPNGTPRRVAGTIALSRDYPSLLTRARRPQRGAGGAAARVRPRLRPRPRRLFTRADVRGQHRPTTLGPGDLEGLRLLGEGLAC